MKFQGTEIDCLDILLWNIILKMILIQKLCNQNSMCQSWYRNFFQQELFQELDTTEKRHDSILILA